jgi:hypothetical protein
MYKHTFYKHTFAEFWVICPSGGFVELVEEISLSERRENSSP